MEGSVDRANMVDADEVEELTLISTAPPPTDDVLQPEADAHPKAIEALLKEEKEPLEEENEPLEEEKQPLEGEKKPLDEKQLDFTDESEVEVRS